MILKFPPEVIESILAYIPHRNDLLELASVCRQLKSLVVPRHLEYRKVRLNNRHYRPHVWNHLARRKNLTKNIRVVVISFRRPNVRCERYPLALADETLDGPQEVRKRDTMSTEELKALALTMNEVLSNMENLTHFTFEFVLDDGMVQNRLEWIFLQTVLLKHTIRKLSYGGHYNGNDVPEKTKWNLPNLHAFRAPELCTTSHKDLMRKGISQSQMLQCLDVSGDYIDPNLCIPSLEKLVINSTDDSQSETVIKFLSINSSIKILDWSTACVDYFFTPFHYPFLPNLEKLDCQGEFFDALGRCYQYHKKIAHKNGTTPPAPWKIERLKVLPFDYLTPRAIVSFQCIEGKSLRETTLWTNTKKPVTMDDWEAIQLRFPNIEDLSLYTSKRRRSTWIPPFPVLLNVVPQFRSLHKCRFTNHLAAYLGTRFITDPTARLDTTPYYARNSGASTLDLDLATSSLLQLHAFFLRLGQSSNVKTLDFPFTLKPLAAKILPGLSAGDEMEVDEVEEEEEEGHPEPGSESEEEEDGAEEPILPVIDLMRQHVAIGEEPSPPPTGSSIRGYATILDRSGATQIRVWWQMRDELTNRILFSSLRDDLNLMGAFLKPQADG